MRVIEELNISPIKVTIFHWNNRYLIKLELGLLEQTYKIHEYDVTSESDVKKILSEKFIEAALQQFIQMQERLSLSLSEI